MSNCSSISADRVLLCEGPEDIYFFQRLIKNRKLQHFQVCDTSDDLTKKGGNSKFGDKLIAIKLDRNFSRLKHIVIATDCDDDAVDSFIYVQSQVFYAGLPCPTYPLASAGSKPKVSIVMMPPNKIQGNLENYCIKAAKCKDPILAAFIDEFLKKNGSDMWKKPRVYKAWLRIFLAAKCEKDPFVFLGSVFKNDDLCDLISVTHNSFDKLAKYLSTA